jgi:hypothetical protein
VLPHNFDIAEASNFDYDDDEIETRPPTPNARIPTVAQHGFPERAMLRQEEDRDWYDRLKLRAVGDEELTISPTAVAHCKVHYHHRHGRARNRTNTHNVI